MRYLDFPLQLHHLPNALYQSVCLLQHGPFYYCLSFAKLLWNQHRLQLFEIHDSEPASNLRIHPTTLQHTPNTSQCTLSILPAIHCYKKDHVNSFYASIGSSGVYHIEASKRSIGRIHELLISRFFAKMENIKHSHVEVKGLKLHVAEIGTGEKTVLFLHGFPEIWYTWRYQMIAVANAGYRAIAFDSRGYGLSDHPAEPEKATSMDLVHEAKDLLDSLGISKAFLIGKDSGAIIANLVPVVYPETVASLITLGIPFMLPGPSAIQNDLLPKGFYITRWQEPGRAEADFGRFDVKSVIRNIYILFSKSEVPVANDDQEIMDLFNPSTPLPPWFSEEDLTVYASLYEKSGFRFALQVPYRSLTVESGLIDPKVNVPALLIMGEEDYCFKFPGMEDYIRSGVVKNFVPNLETIYIPEGSHFVHEQFPEKVNKLIIEFLDKQTI